MSGDCGDHAEVVGLLLKSVLSLVRENLLPVHRCWKTHERDSHLTSLVVVTL